MLLNGRRIVNDNGESRLILLAMEDITPRLTVKQPVKKGPVPDVALRARLISGSYCRMVNIQDHYVAKTSDDRIIWRVFTVLQTIRLSRYPPLLTI